MLARVRSATLRGIEAALVSVEVDGSSGIPSSTGLVAHNRAAR
jgi:hypothetical protein